MGLGRWVCALLLGATTVRAAADVTIAAAADLKFALEEVLAGYQQQHAEPVRATYGSSGNFYVQLTQGAPFAIFMAADETLIQRLAAQGLTRDDGDLYALGRIVLFAPNAAPFSADPEFTDLRRALAAGHIGKFAIANPDHAPYGRAAREALTAAGLWTALEPHLVRGDNVAQTAQFAVSGAAQGGIFALSLALAPVFANAGHYALIPAALHQPLRQRMVLMHAADSAATAVYQYLKSPAARAVLRRYGFTVPDE